MAYPDTEVNRFRLQVGRTIEAIRDIDPLLAIVEDHGATDQERQAFFAEQFGEGTNNSDITWAQFAAGILALRAIRTAWGTNKFAIAKLLK
jgi:hypothetical protein